MGGRVIALVAVGIGLIAASAWAQSGQVVLGTTVYSLQDLPSDAITGFTESVLTELLHDGSPITLSQVDMPAMNPVPFDSVKSQLPDHSQPVPPIYQPEICAKVVVDTAERPRRRTWVAAVSRSEPSM